MVRWKRRMSSNRHNRFTAHATASIHNPLRLVQSRTTDFVSVESYPHDRDRASPARPPPHDLPVRHPSRHARLPGRAAARFPEAERERAALPRGRHRRRLAAQALVVLAAGAQRRGAEDHAQGAQGHPRHLRPRQPRRGGAAILPAHLRRRAGRGRGDPRRRRRPQAAGDPRRPVRRHRALRALARHPGRLGLRHGAAHQHRPSTGAAASSACPTGRCRPT